MSTIAELENQVLELSEQERLALVNRVLERSDASDNPEVQTLWDKEILRRIELLDNGLAERIPASEVFSKLDARLA